jgi:hypothetical protein
LFRGSSTPRQAAESADPLRSRRLFLGGLAVGVVAMSATGLAALALVITPAELAAQSSAPAPALITASTRWRVLTEHIVTTGTVRAARTIPVTGSAPFAVLVVTRLPVHEGDRVWPGHVIAEIDGRPVLLLRGRLPPYRDLHEGDTGPDVKQLQESLELVGFADFDPAGLFGPSTALALGLLYRDLGYTPPLFRPPPTPGLTRPRASPYLPMTEVVFIPARSAFVVSVATRVGALVTAAPLIQLATGQPYVTAELTPSQAALVRRGTQAVIAGVAVATAGRLQRVRRFPSGAAAYPVVVTSRRRLPQRLIGARVRLTLVVPVTAVPVLSVPLAAVSGTGRSRSPYVVVVTPARPGRPVLRRRVPVVTGPLADGWVAVQPVVPGALRAGSRVLVGIRR